MPREMKRYGHIPRELWPHLPRMVDVMREKGVRKPYDAVAEIFDVSASRVQQLTITYRRLEREEARRAILDSVPGAEQRRDSSA